jgi:hypothetical protein
VPAPVIDLTALDCLGFGGDPADLISAVLPRVERLNLAGEDEILAWTDEVSGARLVLGCHGVDVQWMWPTLWAATAAALGGLAPLGDDVVSAAVLDETGGRAARLVLRLEEGRTLTPEMCARSWPAAIVALGPVRVFADVAAFEADPVSIVGDPTSYAAQAPEHFVQRGWAWPPRLAAESLDAAGGPLPLARLTGVVRAVEHRRNGLTGHQFTVARVRTLGLDLDLCLAADHPEVVVGAVVAGTVTVVGRLGAAPSDPRQRWVQRAD